MGSRMYVWRRGRGDACRGDVCRRNTCVASTGTETEIAHSEQPLVLGGGQGEPGTGGAEFEEKWEINQVFVTTVMRRCVHVW